MRYFILICAHPVIQLLASFLLRLRVPTFASREGKGITKEKAIFGWALIIVMLLLNTFPVMASDRVLVLRSAGENFSLTFNGLVDDLDDDVSFIDQKVDDNVSGELIAKYIQQAKPDLLVFLGNKPLRAYSEYQQHHRQQSFPPSVAMSALYLDRQLKKMKNTTGIRYEIPAVTGLVQLRAIVKRPLKKGGRTLSLMDGGFYCTKQSLLSAGRDRISGYQNE